MKKIYLIITIIIVVLALLVGAFFGVRVLNSPEYALRQISVDVKESGIDGLMPHLTEDTREKIAKIKDITDNKLVSTVLKLLDKTDFVGVLKSNLKEVEWNLVDIAKEKETAAVTLGFNYQDLVKGTIDINMIKENGDWKISGIEMPKF